MGSEQGSEDLRRAEDMQSDYVPSTTGDGDCSSSSASRGTTTTTVSSSESSGGSRTSLSSSSAPTSTFTWPSTMKRGGGKHEQKPGGQPAGKGVAKPTPPPAKHPGSRQMTLTMLKNPAAPKAVLQAEKPKHPPQPVVPKAVLPAAKPKSPPQPVAAMAKVPKQDLKVLLGRGCAGLINRISDEEADNLCFLNSFL